MLASLGQNHVAKHAGSFTLQTILIAFKYFLSQLNLLLQTWPERAAAPGKHGWGLPGCCDKQYNMFTNVGQLEGPKTTISQKRWLKRNVVFTDRIQSLSGLFLLAEKQGEILGSFCFILRHPSIAYPAVVGYGLP